jgi:hypothetical protein
MSGHTSKLAVPFAVSLVLHGVASWVMLERFEPRPEKSGTMVEILDRELFFRQARREIIEPVKPTAPTERLPALPSEAALLPSAPAESRSPVTAVPVVPEQRLAAARAVRSAHIETGSPVEQVDEGPQRILPGSAADRLASAEMARDVLGAEINQDLAVAVPPEVRPARPVAGLMTARSQPGAIKTPVEPRQMSAAAAHELHLAPAEPVRTRTRLAAVPAGEPLTAIEPKAAPPGPGAVEVAALTRPPAPAVDVVRSRPLAWGATTSPGIAPVGMNDSLGPLSAHVVGPRPVAPAVAPVPPQAATPASVPAPAADARPAMALSSAPSRLATIESPQPVENAATFPVTQRRAGTVPLPPGDEMVTAVRQVEPTAALRRAPALAGDSARMQLPASQGPDRTAPSSPQGVVIGAAPADTVTPVRPRRPTHDTPEGELPSATGIDLGGEFNASLAVGECFFAARPISLDGTEIISYAARLESVQRFEQALAQAVKANQRIGWHRITEDQCASISFLRLVLGTSAPSLNVRLDRNEIESGSVLAGHVADKPSKVVTVLLVDDNGVVHNMFEHLSSGPDGIELSATVYATGDGRNRVQLVMAVAADAALPALASTQRIHSDEFFQQLYEQAREFGATLELGLDHFVLF